MAKADMPKMLSALATMRSSVDSLVNVPEFVGVSDKVAMLETRVKELSVPKLADAIDKKQGVSSPAVLHVAAPEISQMSSWRIHFLCPKACEDWSQSFQRCVHVVMGRLACSSVSVLSNAISGCAGSWQAMTRVERRSVLHG